jgi:GNAT superfamily N-acetyltransferase
MCRTIPRALSGPIEALVDKTGTRTKSHIRAFVYLNSVSQFLPSYSESAHKFIGDDLKNAWHFQLLAVSPRYQGKGVGSSLFLTGRDFFYSQGVSLYLETQKAENVCCLRLAIP